MNANLWELISILWQNSCIHVLFFGKIHINYISCIHYAMVFLVIFPCGSYHCAIIHLLYATSFHGMGDHGFQQVTFVTLTHNVLRLNLVYVLLAIHSVSLYSTYCHYVLRMFNFQNFIPDYVTPKIPLSFANISSLLVLIFIDSFSLFICILKPVEVDRAGRVGVTRTIIRLPHAAKFAKSHLSQLHLSHERSASGQVCGLPLGHGCSPKSHSIE